MQKRLCRNLWAATLQPPGGETNQPHKKTFVFIGNKYAICIYIYIFSLTETFFCPWKQMFPRKSYSIVLRADLETMAETKAQSFGNWEFS